MDSDEAFVVRVIKGTGWFCVIAAVLILAARCQAEEPVTETGASAYFAAERILSSAGPAQDEAAAIAFGQIGFGRWGMGALVKATGTLQPGVLDVSRVRTLELAIAPHWYAYQYQGVAVGPTAWLSGIYGYDTNGIPLKTLSPVTWAGGVRFGGRGAWGIVGYGDHAIVGRGAVQAAAHLPLGDRTALNADLAQSGDRYQVRLRACFGWSK
jgi:hypothetical protein